MSNDFWFSIAIAAIAGGFWLYKKGKAQFLQLEKSNGLSRGYA